MKLKRMTACFGRLDHETLELEDGLNILRLPNESGKTTWSEFLLAMLYGIDTRKREKAGQLPAKVKYAPWSGRSMEGSLELVHQGRTLVLERTSTPKSPMGLLKIYDKQSGSPVSELNTANCGEALIGAPRSVYERSGFLRQQELAVSQDGALEQRLGNLVTAGSEDYSCSAVMKQLTALENRCRHNKTGLLPEKEAELAALRSQTKTRDEAEAVCKELEQSICALEAQEQTLLQTLDQLDAAEREQTRRELEDAEQALSKAREDRLEWDRVCAGLPGPDALFSLERELSRLQQAAQTAAMESTLAPPELPQSPEFPVFAGLTPAQAKEQARADRALTESLLDPPPAPGKHLWLSGILLALAVLLTVGGEVLSLLWLFAGAAALAAAAAGWWCFAVLREKRELRREAEDLERATAILTRYDVSVPEEIPSVAEAFDRETRDYLRLQAETQKQILAAQQTAQALQLQRRAFLTRIQGWVPECDSLQRAAMFLSETRQSWLSQEAAARLETQKAAQLAQLRRAVGPLPEADEAQPLPASLPDRETTRAALEDCRVRLRNARSALDQQLGALGAMVPEGDHQAREAELCDQIRQLERLYEALGLSKTLLLRADDRLRARFSPLLCQKAGELFRRLTGGRYDRIVLDRAMNVSVGQPGQSVTRPLDYLSSGTKDQLYLALRLAICDLILPEAPMILDDALLCFDPERREQAMQTLREEAAHRQIILFTCQSPA